MYIERFFVPGLAHASYLIAAEGEAVELAENALTREI